MRASAQRGFTLVELMVSLVVFSFAVVGILSVGISMTNGFREQRDAVNAESLVRLPIDFLTDAVRQASPAVPGFNITDSATCSLSALTVANSSTAPDTLDVIYAVGGVVTSTATMLNSTSSWSVNVVDATGLSTGDYVVISDITEGAFFKIAVSGNTLTLDHACGGYALPANGFAAGSVVVRAMHATFSIGTIDTVNGVPITGLLMDPDSALNASRPAEPFAENIEDMQIAVGIDGTVAAGIIDGLTEVGTVAGDDDWAFNKSGETVPLWPPAAPSVIRAVRLTIVARSASQDVGNSGLYTRPPAEDRAGGSPDTLRRRILKSTIEFRNVGASP